MNAGMKSTLSPRMRRFWGLLLLILSMSLAPMGTQAQSRDGQGAQAQSGALETWQGEPAKPGSESKQADATVISTPMGYRGGDAVPADGAWERMLARRLSPNQPHRPIPTMLIILGLVFMMLWAASLTGLILTIGTGLAVVMLILAIVFLPLLILGVIFLIGGIIAATSGQHKPK